MGVQETEGFELLSQVHTDPRGTTKDVRHPQVFFLAGGVQGPTSGHERGAHGSHCTLCSIDGCSALLLRPSRENVWSLQWWWTRPLRAASCSMQQSSQHRISRVSEAEQCSFIPWRRSATPVQCFSASGVQAHWLPRKMKSPPGVDVRVLIFFCIGSRIEEGGSNLEGSAGWGGGGGGGTFQD